jgi:hypothetical protein
MPELALEYCRAMRLLTTNIAGDLAQSPATWRASASAGTEAARMISSILDDRQRLGQDLATRQPSAGTRVRIDGTKFRRVLAATIPCQMDGTISRRDLS